MDTKLIKEITRKIGPHGRVRLSKPRIPPMSVEEYNEKQKRILDESLWAKEVQFVLNKINSYKGIIINVLKAFMEHPEFLLRSAMLGQHILSQSSLPEREREILILRIGWLCGAEYEWAQHKMTGAMCGLRTKEIRRITKGADAEGWDPFDATLIRAVDELYRDCFISEATWKALTEHYNKQQLIDLIFTVGWYNSICMLLNTLGVQLDDGFTGFPREKK